MTGGIAAGKDAANALSGKTHMSGNTDMGKSDKRETINKNEVIELTIDDLLDDGRAFGRYGALAVFVRSSGRNVPRSAVPGDRILAKVTKAKKSVAEAALVSVIGPSPDRCQAACEYFGICGGCTMQELSYEAQTRLKRAQVISKLERLGGIKDPVVRDMKESTETRYYRNKAVFAVGPDGEVGFVRGRSHSVIDIDDCILQMDTSMVCADALREFLRRTGVKCITRMMVRTGHQSGEVMVVIETDKKDIPRADELAELLDDAIYSLCRDEGSDGFYSLESVAAVHQGKCRITAGRPTITDTFLAGLTEVSYEISPQSFFQVNPEQMAVLYDTAYDYAGITNRKYNKDDKEKKDSAGDLCGDDEQPVRQPVTILDLYCGAGTIGIWMLSRLRNEAPEIFERTRVIGIESVKSAVLDANRNSVINGLVNTRYICGRAEEELPGMMGLAKLYKQNEVNEIVERDPEIRIDKADIAILDPPRAGCEEALLEAVAAASPERIVYVSCDPGTLARDIKYLTANGYEFIECTPVDQFPQTSHTETVVLMSRKDT